MPKFGKRLSQRLRRSRSNASPPDVPLVSITPTETMDGEEGVEKVKLHDASELTDTADSPPLPGTSVSRFPSSTLPFRKPKWARIRPSGLQLPADCAPERGHTTSAALTTCGTNRHPPGKSKEASPRSSSAPNASTLAELPAVGPSLTSNIPLNGKPPWDRTVEIVWTRRRSHTEESDRADEATFRENLNQIIAHGSVIPMLVDPPPGSESIVPSSNETGYVEQSNQANANGLKATSKTPSKARVQNANSRYFQLPDAIRLRITKHLVQSHNPHNKPIRMNNPYFLHSVWPVNRPANKPRPKPAKKEKEKVQTQWPTEEYESFDSLESVLSSLQPYTAVCAALRADVLATLFLARRFHVVYALGVTRALQPAATEYMDRYGPLMASVTLELDFTKLGGSWKPEAANLDALAGMKSVKRLVERFVDRRLAATAAAGRRYGAAAAAGIHDLKVLVRRYYYHSISASSSPSPGSSSSHPPEAPDDHIVSNVLSPLKRLLLESRIDTLTLSGTSKSVALELLAPIRGRTNNRVRPTTTAECDYSDPDGGNAAQDGGEAREEETLVVDDDDDGDILYRMPAREWPLLLPGSDQGCVVNCGPEDGGVRLITWDQRAGVDCEVAGCRRRLAATPVSDQGIAAGEGDGAVGDGEGSDGGGQDMRAKSLRRTSETWGVRAVRSFSSGSPVAWPRLLARQNREDRAGRGGEVEDTKEHREENSEEVGGEGREQKRRLARRVLERAVSGGAKGLFGYY